MIDDAELSKLDEEQLIALNDRVIKRIRFLRQRRVHEALGRFAVGDFVTFLSESGEVVVGVVLRCNHKTVTVMAEDRQIWRISPGLLSRVTHPSKNVARKLSLKAAHDRASKT